MIVRCKIIPPEEVGMHDEVVDYFDAYLKGEEPQSGDSQMTIAAGGVAAYKAKGQLLNRKGGKFAKTDTSRNPDNEPVRDLGDESVHQAATKEALLATLSNQQVTAKTLGMERLGKNFKRAIETACTILRREIAQFKFFEEQRRKRRKAHLADMNSAQTHAIYREKCNHDEAWTKYLAQKEVIKALDDLEATTELTYPRPTTPNYVPPSPRSLQPIVSNQQKASQNAKHSPAMKTPTLESSAIAFVIQSTR